MPIHSQWEDETHRVLRITLIDEVVSWDDYHSAMQDVYELVTASDTRPHILMTSNGNVPMPAGNSFPHLKRELVRILPHCKIAVGVLRNRLALRVLRAANQAFRLPKQYYLAKSEAEAYALMQRYDRQHPES